MKSPSQRPSSRGRGRGPGPSRGAPRAAQSSAADHLARLRKLCLALPETSEKVAWEAPTFRVRGKLFAMYAEKVHGDHRIAAWLAAPVGAQTVLCASEPERFFVPPYVGKSGWVGVDLDAVGDARLASLVRDAWCRIAPPKLRASLEPES